VQLIWPLHAAKETRSQKEKRMSQDQQLSGETVMAGRAPDGQQSGSSTKKVLSNRKNALRSTGPKTVRGKQNSARNAVKHGIFSDFTVVQDREGGEKVEDYQRLLNEIEDSYQPQSFLERMLVEEVVLCIRQKRRLLRAERGAVSLNLAKHRCIVENRNLLDDLAEKFSKDPNNDETDALHEHLLIPRADDASKFLRYYAMVENRLSKATAKLDELQAKRRGNSAEK
jgi:hypothetical protein